MVEYKDLTEQQKKIYDVVANVVVADITATVNDVADTINNDIKKLLLGD